MNSRAKIAIAVSVSAVVLTGIVLAVWLKKKNVALPNGTAMKPQEFIDTFKNSFKRATKGTPLFTSVKLAQAALETGWGRNTINGANNMFGIKATGNTTPYWNGDKILAGTKEDYGNGQISISDYFRKYKSLEDSIRDHSHLLMSLDRYAPVRNATTAEEQARQLQACGYATATNYADSLINIINQYNLKQYD